MKVCSLYGAGFYYMPGTDICIKLGGYVRFQAYYGWGNNGTFGTVYGGSGLQTAAFGQSNDFVYRSRATVTVDTRQQTEYGTLRSYTLIGYQHDSPGAGGWTDGSVEGLYAKRGFIQLAGFTFGKAQSFYDIWSIAANSYFAVPSSDTGDPGMMLAAYTAQFGNGFTGTISLEDPRRTSVASSTAFGSIGTTDAFPANNYGNVKWPDVVGVLRVDQAWGSAQVMAAIHDVDANYYNATTTTAGTTPFGHPSDKVGFAVGGGAIIKTPFISPGDNFSFQVNYAEGATRYIDLTPGGGGSPYYYGSGNSFGTLLYTDGVYSPLGSNIELTKSLGLDVSYDHVWNQKWKTSVYGGLVDVKYSDTAKSYMAATGGICAAYAFTNCNPDGNQWWIGTRTQFNINASTYLGLDVMYRKLDTGFAGAGALPANGARPAGVYAIENQDAVATTFRIERDFLP